MSSLMKCVDFEKQSLSHAKFPISYDIDRVAQTINELASQIQSNEELKNELVRVVVSARCVYQEMCQKKFEIPGSPTDKIASQLEMGSLEWQLDQIYLDFYIFVENIRKALENAEFLVREVANNFIKQWQWNKKFYRNNFVLTGVTLDTLQGWCEKLFECLWKTREQTRTIHSYLQQLNSIFLEVKGLHQSSHADEILVQQEYLAKEILLQLINKAFIVVKQPCSSSGHVQVLKKDVKFITSVRLLIGGEFALSIMNSIVKVSIISEQQARQIVETNTHTGAQICNLLHDQCRFEYNEMTRHLIANFLTAKFTKIHRPVKKDKEVTDDKFALLFESHLTIGDLIAEIQTMSLPIALIVHVRQESQARPSIFWDNSFALIDRMPFEVTDQVTWKQFSQALNQIFAYENNRGLTPENLHFLAEKFFNQRISFPVPDNLIVTWSKFCKENLPNRDFTFWKWFYSILKVTREHMRGPWQAGLINGFINKWSVNELLKDCADGTFMLRFSDSELGEKKLRILIHRIKFELSGCISIGWLHGNLDRSCVVKHVQPFSVLDFATRSLPDRICDLEELTILYPCCPKREAFDKFTTITARNAVTSFKDPYVKAGVVTVLRSSED